MTNKQKDIDNMKCWVFRMAQKSWNKKPEECAQLFCEYGLFKYISESYDYLHLNGYNTVLNDLENILREKGVSISA